jgi:hypothetical protein
MPSGQPPRAPLAGSQAVATALLAGVAGPHAKAKSAAMASETVLRRGMTALSRR